jgi:hypothetical protein
MGQMKIVSTGTLGALNAAVTAEFRHLSNGAAGVQLTGTFSGTFVLEVTMDGTNWDAYAIVVCSTGATATSITATGQYRTELVGVSSVRVRCSAYTSGTATATLVLLSN